VTYSYSLVCVFHDDVFPDVLWADILYAIQELPAVWCSFVVLVFVSFSSISIDNSIILFQGPSVVEWSHAPGSSVPVSLRVP